MTSSMALLSCKLLLLALVMMMTTPPATDAASRSKCTIDIHGAIDLLNFKYGNVASTRGTRSCLAVVCKAV